ncbi:hypothetical protein [Bordetella bronchiseptica]|uniref:hypothetical protein n=1 Tax=Bordetella bronchiseptica TaxID=518 RepID=UPI000461E6CC|nr:hypothetical protein [Bordetella bronchiseptica]KDD18636.1 hypothetical protein L522_4186 [Bordetella bronchiseptica MBORD707]
MRLDEIPDEVSPDGSCFIRYTRDKSGRIVAAHCIPAAPTRRRATPRQRAQLQKLESLFS